MIFFADTGTLPPPFNLIPNPYVLFELVTWLWHRVRSKGDGGVQARCSAYRCCYLDHPGTRSTSQCEADYQKLMSTLIQRYFLALDDAKKDASSKNDASGSSKGYFLVTTARGIVFRLSASSVTC